MAARDLEKDLTICDRATSGPWVSCEDAVAVKPLEWVCQMYDHGSEFSNAENNAQFIAEARQGWPYAIRRAIEAEAEIDRLRNELDILQEQVSFYSGRCKD